jgi:hypothetical protein
MAAASGKGWEAHRALVLVWVLHLELALSGARQALQA